MSDIDTVVVNSLKALDPEWPIREADVVLSAANGSFVPKPVIGSPIRSPRRRGRAVFYIFRAEAIFEHGEVGEVASWPRQVLNKAGADRIGDQHESASNSAASLRPRSGSPADQR